MPPDTPDTPDTDIDKLPGTPGLTVAEAAARLGVTSDAIYKGLRRGRYQGHKTASGEWRVQLDTAPDTGLDRPPDSLGSSETGDQTATGHGIDTRQTDALQAHIDSLEARVRFMEEELGRRDQQLARRDEEIARRDVILLNLSRRLPELEPPDEQPPEPRPWWRRLF